jgi:S-adenosylmethionine:tRNA ribosyltransferase-isomerase
VSVVLGTRDRHPARELREADRPPEARGLARDSVLMLTAYRAERELERAHFADLPELLAPGDLLVINTSRTLPAALRARDAASGAAHVLHLSTPAPGEAARDGATVRWIVELRSPDGERRRGHAGQRLELSGGARAELLAAHLGGRLGVAELELGEPLLDYLDRHGVPIRYRHTRGEWPLDSYQNVYGVEPGSAEMPSAGRPFTAEAITELVARGIDVAPVLLHTGVSSLERGERPYPERFEVSSFTAARANLVRELGGRVIAVGTTVVRALESSAGVDGRLRPAAGWTDLVIGGERPVRAVDGILTGFHDGDSSHIELLAELAGPALLDDAYEAALEHGYLRHEFGDLLLVLPRR